MRSNYSQFDTNEFLYKTYAGCKKCSENKVSLKKIYKINKLNKIKKIKKSKKFMSKQILMQILTIMFVVVLGLIYVNKFSFSNLFDVSSLFSKIKKIILSNVEIPNLISSISNTNTYENNEIVDKVVNNTYEFVNDAYEVVNDTS